MSFWFGVVTGHGSDDIDGGTGHFLTAYETQGLTVTSPRVRQLSTVEPLEWQYAGSVGWGQDASGEIVVLNTKHIRFTHQSESLAYQPGYTTKVFWKLPPGVEIALAVYW